MKQIFPVVEERPVFGGLDIEQPFISEGGELCIKQETDSYIVLADQHGRVDTGWRQGIDLFAPIVRALPKIEKLGLVDLGAES